ncbi:hypothetical protein L1887_03129 [Cichorium endivia]|nr:hypothetical protein L1887_03129 [Cichorium endivia]
MIRQSARRPPYRCFFSYLPFLPPFSHVPLFTSFHYRKFRQTLLKLLCLKIMAEPEANQTTEPLMKNPDCLL